MCILTLPWCAHGPEPLLIPTWLSPWGCCPLLGLGTSQCHSSAAVVGRLPAAAHGIAEDFEKTACGEGVVFLITLSHWDVAWDLWGRAGLMGLGMSTVALSAV